MKAVAQKGLGMTEDESRKLDDLHEFFMREDEVTGKPSRAKQIDELLGAARFTKFGFRAFLYFCAFIAAASGAVATIKGWMPK